MEITRIYDKLSAPAIRALESAEIGNLEDLSTHTRKSIMNLHGIGPSAMKIIESEMMKMKLRFAQDENRQNKDEKGKNDRIDDYIREFPATMRIKLDEMRKIIREAAPEAEERISYKMPAYYQNGYVAYFGGHEKHVGFYPTGSGIEAFKNEISAFKSSKGAVQFPLDQPLPKELVIRMVKFKIKENMERENRKYRAK
jgi:uncharacterized protein YdhG (YjbR/CyaY superfamily)